MRMRILFVLAGAMVACNRTGVSFQPPAAPVVVPMAVQPDTLHVIPFFQFHGGKDGGVEQIGSFGGAAFIGDPGKALYSVTPVGGIDKCRLKYYRPGCGVAYELTRQKGSNSYKETVLHRFDKTDGGVPTAALVEDAAGSLYGTTTIGGEYDEGTVFRLTRSQGSYKETVLYSFKGGMDGGVPGAPLIFDDKGAFYGTTSGSTTLKCNGTSGTSQYCGTVFKLTPSGSRYTEKVLHLFLSDGKDGIQPETGLIADAKGNLFGTTAEGGTAGIGTVFELTPTASGDYKERILSDLGHGGYFPSSGVVEENGAFYGTTTFGGSGYCISFHFYLPPGCGVLFKVAPHGSGYVESVVHDFATVSGGFFPLGVISGHDGFLYGTTYQGGYVKGRACRGGSSGYGYAPAGCGVVYRLRPSGADFQVLHAFKDRTDGNLPDGGFPNSPLLDVGSVLYGTNTIGGTYKQGVGFALKL
jgi:uncharacterized repeat protein (TIGR03803 family)